MKKIRKNGAKLVESDSSAPLRVPKMTVESRQRDIERSNARQLKADKISSDTTNSLMRTARVDTEE
jgi:hypothetical protein